MTRALAVIALALSVVASAQAAPAFGPADFAGLAITQNLGRKLPLDAVLRDDGIRTVSLGALLQGKPLVLVLGYFRCPNLCGLERRALIEAFNKMRLEPGKDFNLAVISVDPREGPAEAESAKHADLAVFTGRTGAAGWHYLTGDRPDLDRIATAAGFDFRYDAELDQYAHPIGLILVTPQGILGRYIEGFGFTPRDLELGLIDVAGGAIASPSERFLLLCYHYNPTTGRYDLLVSDILRGLGLGTVAALGLFVFFLTRQGKR